MNCPTENYPGFGHSNFIWQHDIETFPQYRPLERRIHQSRLDCLHEVSVIRDFDVSYIAAWIYCWTKRVRTLYNGSYVHINSTSFGQRHVALSIYWGLLTHLFLISLCNDLSIIWYRPINWVSTELSSTRRLWRNLSEIWIKLQNCLLA